MTNCDWFFSIECSAPESEVRSHSNSCEGPPPEPQHSCCFGAGLVHANTQNNIQDTHLETSRRFGMSVSSLTHSLAHPTYSSLFHLLTLPLPLSLFYKGRYTNNPHMFSSFLTYSCLLEDEHTSLCLFLSISFTHIHDQAHAIIVSLSVPDIGTLRYIHIPNASPPFSIHLFHTFSLSVLLLNFAQVILDTQNDSFSLKQTQACTLT